MPRYDSIEFMHGGIKFVILRLITANNYLILEYKVVDEIFF